MDGRSAPVPAGPGIHGARHGSKSFLPADLLCHTQESSVDRIVLVQMSYYGSDNSYMLEVIRRQPGVFRGIAVVDYMLEQPDAQIHRLVAFGVRGLRIELNKDFSSLSAEGPGWTGCFGLPRARSSQYAR